MNAIASQITETLIIFKQFVNIQFKKTPYLCITGRLWWESASAGKIVTEGH